MAHFLPLWFSIRIRTGNIPGVLTGKVNLARLLIAAARGETRIHSATLCTQLVQYYCGIYQHPKHRGRAMRRFFCTVGAVVQPTSCAFFSLMDYALAKRYCAIMCTICTPFWPLLGYAERAGENIQLPYIS